MTPATTTNRPLDRLSLYSSSIDSLSVDAADGAARRAVVAMTGPGACQRVRREGPDPACPIGHRTTGTFGWVGLRAVRWGELEHAFQIGSAIVVASRRAGLPPRRPVRAHGRPAAGHRSPRGRARPRPPPPDAAGRDGQRQDIHDGPDHPAAPEADAGPRPQQDAGGPAVQRVPGVLPGQRRRVLRQLLRLLPAGGVPPALRHVHREGQQPERGDRPAPPRGHPRAVRAARRDHRGVRVVHLRPGRAGGLRGHGAPPAGRRPVPAGRRAAPPRGPPVPAQRRVAHPGEVPRPRRHPGDRPRLVRDHRPGRVLRRRGGADHGAGPADRASCWPSARSSTSSRPRTS